MKDLLLSIIIPCYNVAPFLNKCIDSVLNQTYTNIEILLVDDGSTDKTATLCDEFAKRDTRVKVIHQENKGLPATRKVGIDAISGEYVTFVDADDWIHPRMYEIMLQGMVKEQTDIAQCGVCDAYEKGTVKHRITNEINASYSIYNREESVLKILNDREWNSYMWNKIYKATLFNNVIFPIGRQLDEDLSIQHILFHSANGSIYFSSEFYFYLHRQNSICSTTDLQNLCKKIIDRSNARWERYLFVRGSEEYKAMQCKMENIYISVTITGLRTVVKHPNLFPPDFFSGAIANIKSIHLSSKNQWPEYFSRYKKIELFLIYHVPFFYRFLFKLV